ncbi:MAG: glucose 1-dehydrogenase [Candidatus Aerophobetes bacterium]|nr:glucose 1-dehydrogenase [Candidatus Aerophobetes bacterium]
MKLLDKVAIITGGNKGIGKGISLRLAEEGSDVVIAARDKISAENVLKEIRKKGRDCLFVKTDVSKKEEVDVMIEATIKQFGEIDILVNNAGIVIDRPFLEITEQIWDRVLNVNLKGYFLCSQAAAKAMVRKKKGGKIINITSIQGVRVWTRHFHAPYEVSKAGIIMLTKQIAFELAPYKINVNAVGPGPTETQILNYITTSPEKLNEFVKDIPLGRIAKPSDIGAAVAFLASEDADYITGVTLFVDGGRMTH